jgi:hypothetical protein
MFRPVAAGVLIAASVGAIAAQVPPQVLRPPVGTPGPRVPGGAAGITGVVVDSDGRPVPSVAVRVIGTSSLQTVVTDQRGRFALLNVVPGEYVLTARKHGFFDGAYGKRRSGGDPLPVALVLGQVLSNLQIELFRAGVITGAVVDEAGEPVVGARVVAIRRQFVDSNWRYDLADTETTDDHGRYRLYGLEPGEYLVSTPTMQVATDLAAESVTGAAVPHTERNDLAYPTVFFPTSRFFVHATPVLLGAGEVRYGVDFRWSPVPARSISGRLTGPGGNNQLVKLVPADSVEVEVGNEAAVTFSNPDGTFFFERVPAGQYRLEAGRSFGLPAQIPVAADSPTASGIFWGRANVQIEDEDVRDVLVRMQPGLSLSGSVTLSKGDSRSAAVSVEHVPITLVPARAGLSRSTRFNINNIGRLIASNLVPGEYFIRVGILPAGWYLRSLTLDGRNLLDEPLELTDDDRTGLAVTLTDRQTVVHGSVRDGRLQPASGAAVIVMPAVTTSWSPNRTRKTRASTNGQFAVSGLPDGDYLVVAVDEALVEGWQDGRILAQLRTLATRFSIREGDSRTMHLRLSALKR